MRQMILSVAAVLVAMPVLAQPDGRRGPPQEAVTACSGLSSGTACGFTINGKNLTGTCSARPGGESATLACKPAGMGGPGGHGHHGPPPEASAACSGLADGASCSFTHDDHSLTGTCRTGPDGSAVACMPAGGPGGRHGPPPEATAACASATAGASCSVTFHGKTMTGSCVAGPQGEALACRPARN